MVNVSNIDESIDESTEVDDTVQESDPAPTYEDAALDEFGDLWNNEVQDETARVENHEFEDQPFDSAIPGKAKLEGFKSQTDRDRSDTLEMLPDLTGGGNGRYVGVAGSAARGTIKPEHMAQEDQLDNEWYDNAATNYLKMNPEEAFSAIQIAEDITPRDSVITREAAKDALRSNRLSGDEIGVRLGELTDYADNEDVADYHSDDGLKSINDMVLEEPGRNADGETRYTENGEAVETRGGWLEDLDEQQEDLRTVGVDEALEYLEEEDPEAINELAIQYIASEIREELEHKDEHSDRDMTGEWIDSYDRETLEQAGALGDEDYEVRGETFYTMNGEKREQVLDVAPGHTGTLES